MNELLEVYKRKLQHAIDCRNKVGIHYYSEFIKDIKFLKMNEIKLIGFIGQDAKSKTTEKGNHVTRFTIATDDGYFNKEKNEYIHNTNWHTVIAWRKLSEKVAQHLKKGTKVFVSGRVTSRVWEKDDQTKQTVVEIEAFRIEEILHTRKETNFPDDSHTPLNISSPTESKPTTQEPIGGGMDDLPF